MKDILKTEIHGSAEYEWVAVDYGYIEPEAAAYTYLGEHCPVCNQFGVWKKQVSNQWRRYCPVCECHWYVCIRKEVIV